MNSILNIYHKSKVLDSRTTKRLIRLEELLLDLFDKDQEKINSWLIKENLSFGGSTPMKLIEAGRVHKVLTFIEAISKGY